MADQLNDSSFSSSTPTSSGHRPEGAPALGTADLAENLAENEEMRSLDARLQAVLETAPSFAIPMEFAARVAAQAAAYEQASFVRPTFAQVSIQVRHHGRNAALVSMGVLLVLILAFAQRASTMATLWVTMEAVFCLQFAFLAVWMVTRDLRQYLPWLSN